MTQIQPDEVNILGAPLPPFGEAGRYGFTQLRRPTMRALARELEPQFTMKQLRDAQNALAQAAAVQQLTTLEQPLLALHNDPIVDPPEEHKWVAVLPVSGPAEANEAAKISVSRVQGGHFLRTLTQRGFPDLPGLYAFFLRDLLPARKHQLTCPLVYHRVVDGIASDDPAKLSLTVLFPIHLSLRAAPRQR